MMIPSKLSAGDVESNYRWVKSIYERMDKIERYQAIVDDEQYPDDTRKALAKEIEIQKQDLEDLKELIRGFRSGLSQLLYKKYIDGYTVDEAALEMGYSPNHIGNIHAQFTKALKVKGLAI